MQEALDALKNELQQNAFIPDGVATGILMLEDHDIPYGGIEKDINAAFEYLRETWGCMMDDFSDLEDLTPQHYTQMKELIPKLVEYRNSYYNQILDLLEME